MKRLASLADSFVVSLVFVQLFACASVALPLLALWPASRSAKASPRYRLARLPAAPTPGSNLFPETRLTITELVPPETPAPVEFSNATAKSQFSWPPATITNAETSRLPLNGLVSQGFGCSAYYTGLPGPGCSPEQPWFHDGIDIAVSAGTPVRATFAGVVIFAGPDSAGPLCGEYRGYGLSVVVDDGQGRQALYAHLSEIEVTAGQSVTPDTVLGFSGATGCVTGPHLHFGLRQAGQPVDPALAVR